MKKILFTFWNIMLSRKTAVLLLSVILFLLTAGSFVPNPVYMTPEEYRALENGPLVILWLAENISPQKLSGSFFFVALMGFLLFSTFVCTLDRLLKGKDPFGEKGFELEIREHGVNTENLISRLMTEKWKVRKSGDKITAEKGKAGFLGSIIFHFSLTALIIGYIYSILFGFSGMILITEGQTLEMNRDSFVSIYDEPALDYRFPVSSIKLDRYIYRYVDNVHPVEYSADFTFMDNNGVRLDEKISVNKPFRRNGFTFLLHEYGFSPNFTIRKNGQKVYDGFFNLKVDSYKKDSITVPDEELTVDVIFYPDFFIGDKGPGTKSPIPIKPVFYITVMDKYGTAAEGFLEMNGRFEAGPYLFEFPELRYWLTVKVIRETGVFVTFLLILIGISGLVLRFIYFRGMLCVRMSKDRITAEGYTPHFPDLLKKEAMKIFEGLKNEPR